MPSQPPQEVALSAPARPFLRRALAAAAVAAGLIPPLQAAGTVLAAQTPDSRAAGTLPPPPSFQVLRAAGEIKVDGSLEDPGWQGTPEISLDWEWTPGDNTAPPVRTVCRVTYDDANLYLGCRGFDPEPDQIRARYFDRDDIQRLVQDDHFLFLIDPFNDQRRAFQFRVSALGGQADAILSTAEGFEDFSWDAIWGSAGRVDDQGYVVEVAIPFKSLRFPRTAEVQTWGFILERSWPRNVRHRVQSAPRDRNATCILCEANKVTGFQGIAPGRNLELVPTVTGSRTDVRPDFPAGPMESGDVDPSFGMDFRWGITPNVSLNATGNPDFSQVEADVAQLDVNTRFALFFPEKRPFFLEGADLFQTPVEAVFTRTVADPDAGLKLSGKIGGSSRTGFGIFGARDAITNLLFPANQGSASTSLDRDSYVAVGRVRQDFGQASYVGGLYTGRFGDGYQNQVAGLDVFHQFSRSLNVRAQYLGSLTEYPESIAVDFSQPAGAFTGGGFLASVFRQTATWYTALRYGDLSPRFRADAGFVPRVDVRSAYGEVARIFRRNRGWYTQLTFWTAYERTHNHGGDLTDEVAAVGVNYTGPLQSSGTLRYLHVRQRFGDVVFDLDEVNGNASLQPTANLGLGLSGSLGEAVDFTNARRSHRVSLSPSARISLGRGLGLNLSHSYQRLSHEGSEVFTANLFQSRVLYNFSVRTFVRAIVQYRSVDRNVAKYTVAVNEFEEGLFTQFLFSYKVNPQTVMFVGYSDNHTGTEAFDLTRANRTFFAKVGYAWRP